MRRLRFIVPLVLMLLSAYASAQNTAKQESRKKQLQKEIEQLERQIMDNDKKSSNALNTLTLVRKQLSSRRALLDESDREISELEDTISMRTAEAAALQARLDTMTAYYHRLVHNAYKNRDARVWYMYLLSSSNLGQASRRYTYLRSLSSQMNRQGTKIRSSRDALARQIDSLNAMKRRAEDLRSARTREVDKLQSEEKRNDNLVAQLKKNKSSYQKQLSTKQKQVEALNREIEKIIAQAVAEASKASKGGTSSSKKSSAKPIDYKLAGEFAGNKGKLPWPADGPVVDRFGRHNHPVYTNLIMPTNNGVNIGLSKGAAVSAVFDGEVRRVIVQPGYNKCVLIQHGNYFTFYCKLGDVSVKAGDKVKTGQTIGTVDTLDGATELHFEIWQETTPQNPETWLRPR